MPLPHFAPQGAEAEVMAVHLAKRPLAAIMRQESSVVDVLERCGQPPAMTTRLAVVVSHPIQYYAPWFAQLAASEGLELMVFHLWDFGVEQRLDRGFGQSIQWDLPLLDGYPNCFVTNLSSDPGTHHFGGLHNPDLVAQLLAWRPDAVLLFGYVWRSHLRVLLDPRLWPIPLLLRGDSHSLAPSSGIKPVLGSLLRRLLFRRFSGALAVGQANAAYLSAAGIAQSRIWIAPHAVDNERFSRAAATASAEASAWRRELGINADTPVVLFAGKFENKKRPLDLLEAFSRLGDTNAVLVLVGAGALEGEIRRRSAAFPPGQVLLLPFHNQRAMPRVYALADLVVLPSYGSGETWGLCINEAMNLAKPVVVSSHVGCGPDLVIPGRTGWIVPAGNVPALTACLKEALADPARLQTMGQAAREHVARFSYAAATASLQQALAQLIKR